MLLEFRVKNYKSFKDELVFSMLPAPKQKGLDYSILKKRAGNKEYKALCSAVVYGPNASGKTNIIGAMDTFKRIILRGHIKNDNEYNSWNKAAYNLELIPNNAKNWHQPIRFSVIFIEKKFHIEYSFDADIGSFLDKEYKRKITFEQLKVNGKLVFERKNDLLIESLEPIIKYLNKDFHQYADSAFLLAKRNLANDELFLMNGFKFMFSSKFVSLITDWLDIQLLIIYRADSVTSMFPNEIDTKMLSNINSLVIEKTAKCFGVLSNKIGYYRDKEKKHVRLQTTFDSLSESISAELYESYGTIRFLNIVPFIITALWLGKTLVIDEFDASIHPMALMNIVNIFHTDEINKKKAQLIFNTHNPIFLNSNMFRRDEIKFMERDDETHASIHYSLSDFGTSGENGVRNNEDYMKNYFINKYGAIKDVDFAPLFENLLNPYTEVE